MALALVFGLLGLITVVIFLVIIATLRFLVWCEAISYRSGLCILIGCLTLGVLQAFVPLHGSFSRPLQLVTCEVSAVVLLVNASYFWKGIRGTGEERTGK